jgi:hypothetical protein
MVLHVNITTIISLFCFLNFTIMGNYYSPVSIYGQGNVFAQDESTIQEAINEIAEFIQDPKTVDNNNSFISILSVLIPSASVIFTVMMALSQYKESQRLRQQELNLQRQKMLFDLTNEIDSSENSEKMFLAKAILDNLSCNIPSYDEKWGKSNKETFEFYLTHYDQLDLNHILRDHYPQPIIDPKERAIRQSFDVLLDYFCRIEYMYKTQIITDKELDYFRYYILKIKDNTAVMKYVERYNFPLSEDFINKVEILSKNKDNYI